MKSKGHLDFWLEQNVILPSFLPFFPFLLLFFLITILNTFSMRRKISIFLIDMLSLRYIVETQLYGYMNLEFTFGVYIWELSAIRWHFKLWE